MSSFIESGSRKVVAGFLLGAFLFVLFFSLFHLAYGMGMGINMSGDSCPFMAHGEVLCPMNLFDHIDGWKGVFTMVVPALVLIVAASLLAATINVAPNLLYKVRLWLATRFRQWRQKYRYLFVTSSLQELFSNGIIHPKLF